MHKNSKLALHCRNSFQKRMVICGLHVVNIHSTRCSLLCFYFDPFRQRIKNMIARCRATFKGAYMKYHKLKRFQFRGILNQCLNLSFVWAHLNISSTFIDCKIDYTNCIFTDFYQILHELLHFLFHCCRSSFPKSLLWDVDFFILHSP